jgi:hypothetical protein
MAYSFASPASSRPHETVALIDLPVISPLSR